MSNEFQTDSTNRQTPIRLGKPLGGMLDGTASDSGWYRLLPDGIGATRTGTKTMTLVDIRADVDGIDLSSWFIMIANDGYEQTLDILSNDGNEITLRGEIKLDPGNTGTELPETEIRYILIPKFLNTINIHFDQESDGGLDIGYTPGFLAPGGIGYSREEVSGETVSPILLAVVMIRPGGGISFKSSDMTDVFYRFTEASDDNRISWGEHKIVKPGGSGGGAVEVVEELPDDADAKYNTLYIVEESKEGWFAAAVTVDEVGGSFTDVAFAGGSAVYTWLEELSSDPDNDGAASYYNTDNGVFRKKEISNTVTLADATIRSDHTDLGVLATEPTDPTDQAIYYNSTDDQFRRKDGGGVDDSRVTSSPFALLSSANYIGIYNGNAAATAANSDNTVLRVYFDSDTRRFNEREIGNTFWGPSGHDEHDLDDHIWMGNSANVLAGSGSSHYATDSEDVDTAAEVLAWFADNGFADGTIYDYYDEDDDEIYSVLAYQTSAWEDTTPEFVFDDDDVEWLGVGGVTGTDDIDTESEVVTYFLQDTVTFDDSVLYVFYDSTDGDIQEVTLFGEDAPWEETDIETVTGNVAAVFVGHAINTDADVLAEIEGDGYSSNLVYVFYDGSDLRQIDSLTETLPEHDAPELRKLAGGGGVDVVDAAPDDEDASEDTLYIVDPTDFGWYLATRTVPEAPGSFTDTEFKGGSDVYVWLTEATSDPSDDDAVAYYNTSNEVLRKKEVGAVGGTITTVDATIRSDHTDLGVLTDDPTSESDQAIYYNSDDSQFRRKDDGALSDGTSTVTTEAFTLATGFPFLGVFATDALADASSNYDIDVADQIYYNSTDGEFRRHSAGSSTWSRYFYHAFNATGHLWLGSDEAVSDIASINEYGAGSEDVDTEAEVIAWFVDNSYDSTIVYDFYDSDAGEIRSVTAYGSGGIAWVDTTPAYVFDDSNVGFLGAGGLTNTSNVDTDFDAVTYFDGSSITFDTSRLYVFYDSSASAIKEISTYTVGVEWENTDIETVSGDSTAVFLAHDINTDADVVSHIETDGYDDSVLYIYYDGSDVRRIGVFTETVPEHEVQELRKLSGGTDVVADLPDDVDSLADVLYIVEGTDIAWYQGMRTVAEVPGSFTDTEFAGGSADYAWNQEHATDPTTILVASSYYNTADGIFRKKEAGSPVDSIATADPTIRSNHTFLDVLTADPTDSLTQDAYYNSTNDIFRRKDNGAISSVVTQTVEDFIFRTNRDFLGVFATDGLARVSQDYDVAESGQYYFSTDELRFRSHSAGSNVFFNVNYSAIAATGHIWMGSDLAATGSQYANGSGDVDTLAEALTWFADNGHNSNRNYDYYDADDGVVYSITDYTGIVAWEDTTPQFVFDDDNVGFLGVSGLDDTADIDTESEAATYFGSVEFDTTRLYIFYDSDADEIRDITGYILAVEWGNTNVRVVSGDSDAVFLGHDVNTDADAVDYIEAYGYDSDAVYVFYDGSDVRQVGVFTETVPEHEVPELREIAGGGTGGGTDGDDGEDGDTPRFSVHTDGDRRVIQLEGYFDSGGTFTAQGTATYVSASGYTTTLADAVDVRGATGAGGGTDGDDGNTPRLSVHTDGDRRVLQLEGYVDSAGTFTAEATATYVSDSGYTTTLADAVDVRGDAGRRWNRHGFRCSDAPFFHPHRRGSAGDPVRGLC